MGVFDIGQGVVVVDGLVFVVEVQEGINVMFDWLVSLCVEIWGMFEQCCGVLVKMFKLMQEWCVDLFIIGLDMVECCVIVGLVGIVLEVGFVLIFECEVVECVFWVYNMFLVIVEVDDV